MPEPYLSVVAPCCNEQAVLPEFHRRAAAACGQVGRDYEIVLVDDGSTDGTWPLLCDLAAEDPHVVAVKLSRNHGHQLALTAGLHVCRGRRVLIIDADCQDPPELLGQMLRIMDDGAEVVYGRRRSRPGDSAFKRATAAAFYRLLERLSPTPIPRDTGDFRLISRRALDVLLRMPERHRFLRGMVSWIGFRQEAIGYDRAQRPGGRTKYPLRTMLRLAVDAITSFSRVPLAAASVLGLGFALFGFGLFVYTLLVKLWGRTVWGWSSIMAAISLLGGVQLVVLGIIGEYLGRLYEQSKDRPLFIIDRIVRGGGGDDAEEPARPA